MSSARTLFVVVVLALIGTLVAWFAASGGGEARAVESLREAPSAPSPSVAEFSSENERAEVVVETAPQAQAPASVTPEPVAPSTPALELRGRLIVLDPDGVELAPLDGRVELTGWRGKRGERLDVEVRAGAWQARFDNANSIDAIEVAEISCGELQPTLESPLGRVPLPTSGDFEIRARLPRPALLRVVDDASGGDLTDVTLVRVAEFPMHGAVHPGASFDERIVGRHLRSPIALDALRASLASGALVGAEGYAWALVKLDFERGGERVVALARGADLEVQVRGVDPAAHSRMRLRTEKHPAPVCEQVLSLDAAFVLRGLEPATYTVHAEVGEWFSEPKQLGVTSATLDSGERVRVELVLEAAPRFERADAGGVVYVPAEWKREGVLIVMKLLDTPLGGQQAHASFPGRRVPSERTGFDAFSWSRKRVQAGRYELGPHEPRFSAVVEVPPAGRTDFELVLPPPVELLVYLVDDQTGDPATVDKLLWNPRRPEGVDGGALDNAERDAAHERYVIRAPACPIELHVWSWDFIPSSDSVDLSQGVTEHTLRLKRSCGLTLRLEDQGTAVALPDEWQGMPHALSGASRVLTSQRRPLSPRWMLSEPGLYQLELPKLPGYRQPPVQSIEVLAGQFTEQVVQLEREHP